MTPQTARRCPIDPLRPVAPGARVRFVRCAKNFPMGGDLSGRKPASAAAARRLLSRVRTKQTIPGRKIPPASARVGVWTQGVQLMVDAYGGAWLAAAGVVAAAKFDASREYFGQRSPLEGPSFTLMASFGLLTQKTVPFLAFWVRHLSWFDRLLSGWPAHCSPRLPAEEWAACRAAFAAQVDDAVAQPAPPPPPDAQYGVFSLLPFYWAARGCGAQIDHRDKDCFRSGHVNTPAQQLRMLRAVVRRHNAYFGNTTVVGVCDDAGAAAVRGALAAGDGRGAEPVFELAVLHCRRQGPRSMPSLRSGIGLPWKLLEHAQRSLSRWGAVRVFYNEPDQVPHIADLPGVLSAVTKRSYVVPHRLEEYPPSLRIGNRTVRFPQPTPAARAFSFGGRVFRATTANATMLCPPRQPLR